MKAGDSITYATGSVLTNGWRLAVTQALLARRAVMAVGSDRTASTAFGDLMTGGTGQESDEILALLEVDVPLYRPDT